MASYVLVDGQPVLEPDFRKWAAFMENSENTGARRVDLTILQIDGAEVKVSTKFTGVDTSLIGGLVEPYLWETVIVGGSHNKYSARYTSQEDAVEGHAHAILVAKGESDPADDAPFGF